MMLEELQNIPKPLGKFEEQNIYISKYASSESGTRDLFEASFYRETCLAQEKQNSILLNITLDKLIKAIAPLK